MIGVCTKCGACFETTQEDANAPGVICPTCHYQPEAVRLLDAFGPWTGETTEESRAWWAKAGYPNAPTVPQFWGLVSAVKLEMARRKFAELTAGGTPYFHFRPRPEA